MSMPRARHVHPEPCVHVARPSKGPLRGRSSNRPGPSPPPSALPTFVLLHSRGNRLCADHYLPLSLLCLARDQRIAIDGRIFEIRIRLHRFIGCNFIWRLMDSWIILLRFVSERIKNFEISREDLVVVL